MDSPQPASQCPSPDPLRFAHLIPEESLDNNTSQNAAQAAEPSSQTEGQFLRFERGKAGISAVGKPRLCGHPQLRSLASKLPQNRRCPGHQAMLLEAYYFRGVFRVPASRYCREILGSMGAMNQVGCVWDGICEMKLQAEAESLLAELRRWVGTKEAQEAIGAPSPADFVCSSCKPAGDASAIVGLAPLKHTKREFKGHQAQVAAAVTKPRFLGRPELQQFADKLYQRPTTGDRLLFVEGYLFQRIHRISASAYAETFLRSKTRHHAIVLVEEHAINRGLVPELLALVEKMRAWSDTFEAAAA